MNSSMRLWLQTYDTVILNFLNWFRLPYPSIVCRMVVHSNDKCIHILPNRTKCDVKYSILYDARMLSDHIHQIIQECRSFQNSLRIFFLYEMFTECVCVSLYSSWYQRNVLTMMDFILACHLPRRSWYWFQALSGFGCKWNFFLFRIQKSIDWIHMNFLMFCFQLDSWGNVTCSTI